jgi:hypothetical protein
MTRNEDDFYRNVQRRTTMFILLIGVGGAVVAVTWRGLLVGGGFLTGAAVSFGSFWRWEQIVSSLGAAPKGRGSLWWMLRSMVLVAVAYGIIRVLGLNLPAALVGLLVSSTAVILELVYELVFLKNGART